MPSQVVNGERPDLAKASRLHIIVRGDSKGKTAKVQDIVVLAFKARPSYWPVLTSAPTHPSYQGVVVVKQRVAERYQRLKALYGPEEVGASTPTPPPAPQ